MMGRPLHELLRSSRAIRRDSGWGWDWHDPATLQLLALDELMEELLYSIVRGERS